MNEQLLSNPIVSQFIGLFVGLFTSFFSWWVLFRWMAPKITLSDHISKTKSSTPIENDEDKSGWRYRFKFENSGRRPVIDLEVRAYVRIKGLYGPDSGIWESVQIPVRTDGGEVYSRTLIGPVRKTKLRTRLKLYLNKADYFRRPEFPPSIRDKAMQRTLTLEDLLNSGTASEVRVIVSGFDELTGARKVSEKLYKLENVKQGDFERKGLLVIEEVPGERERSALDIVQG